MADHFHVTTGAVYHGIWPAGFIEPNRRLYDYELVWFASGTGKVIVGSRVYFFSPGCILLIPPEIVHCTVADGPVERWCIHFDWYGDCAFHRNGSGPGRFFVYDTPEKNNYDPELAAAPPELEGVSFPHFCRTVPEEIYQYIRTFFLHRNRDGLAAAGAFYLALSGILQTRPHHAETVSLLMKAKSVIDREFAAPGLSPGAVARSCHISVNYLNRLFKETFGVSTGDFIVNRKLAHAEKLLTDTGNSIKEIAAMCGYRDYNYFIRQFRAKKGITPGRLRHPGAKKSPE